MKLLLYEMSLFMQRDIEEVLGKLGIDFRVFMYPFEPVGVERDIFFEKTFTDALNSGGYDGVLSMNFWAPVAYACHATGVPYISWVYDCPFGITQSEASMKLPTNRIFVFDRYTVEKLRERGIDTVSHLPLGVNLPRLDSMVSTPEDEEKYGADVSFVGTMYPSGYAGFMAGAGEYARGYIEGAIAAQSGVYGAYLLDSVFTEEVSERIRGEASGGADELFRESLQSLTAKEITRRDRLTILSALSEQCQVKLYTNRPEPILQKVDQWEPIDSYMEIYKVYRASRINLNISFRRIVTGIPLRALDIMGSGGFLLTNWQEEICENFRPGVDCAVYGSIEDALVQAMYFLEHEDERREIARNGRRAMERFSLEKVLSEMIAQVLEG